ncbi:MAG: acetate kinase [Amedibacillus dolichus]|uniref:Acetate kinase n=1 Tax=Amedibacillus dolichus DSM 3991 TaxID=428127 RepID=A8RC98_9FIRM|nr:acetate kinase [Amedibacillus dolichus]EDP11398.1 acetate kinase [Amedibacillus dolichus DSM 3991]MCG4880046.1 acetate kinase [Amedibacillus dolichus]PWL66075.1 MAG: acetate kinase [Amedibacillus dolichus]
MSKIISVNAGSSSLKFQLFEMPTEEVLTSGIIEKIGFEDAIFTIKVNGEKVKKVLPILDHTKAVALLLEALVEHKIVNSLDEITGAGHRAVHGGEIFTESVAVNDEVVEKFSSLNDLAPLHNPAGLIGYNAFKENLPNCKHVFVFDTAFHSTMPRESYMYALPRKYYDEYKVRRYGFHGTSHMYVSQRCAEVMGKDIKDTKIITCHLGNGASITAVDGGKSINTSMGFTPLAGVMMGTRCGDIDPAIVTYLMKKTGMTPDEMDNVMNKQSGMLGVSGISSDARDIEDGYMAGNDDAVLTTEMYVNRVINVVGGYYAQMGGADAIAFTGGIGENDTNIRKLVCNRLKAAFGVVIDEELNAKSRGKEVLLSKPESKVQVWLLPTNEELMIARDTYRLIEA